MREVPSRVRRRLAMAAAILAVAAPVRGLAAGDDATCNRPAITLLRYEEDYSFLGDARCRTERWDPLKYLALSHDLRTSDRLRQRMDEVATTTHEEIRIDGGAAIG